ncbi:uncharacterized protein [Polyergus mexicanus]|uniref:uncharacterized protein n=1 Tax=Polyergus mexicanus TaxID=615972 RepID=UPI0038B5EA87
MDRLSKLTSVQLKTILKNHQLSTAGTKAELVARIASANPAGDWMSEMEEPRGEPSRDEEEGSCFGEEDNAPREHSGPEGHSCERGEHSQAVATRRPYLRRESADMRHRNDFPLRELELMRRERALMARELEVAQQEMEILRNSQRAGNNSNSGRPVNIRAVGDLLSEFNGTDRDFGEWEKQVRLLCQTYELDDNMAQGAVL